MGNAKNLIPQAHKLTVEEQSAGGKKSGEVRRERKAIRELLNDYVDGGFESNAKLRAKARKLGISGDESVKKLFTVACLVNNIDDCTLLDLQRLQEILGEQVKEGEETEDLDAIEADVFGYPTQDGENQ